MIKYIFSVFVLLILLVYVAIFTPLNKTILVPIIKHKVVETTKIKDVEIEDFELTLQNFKMKILLDNQKIIIDSKFNILKQILNANYNIDIENIDIFNHLSKQKLHGSFFTKGDISGSFDNLKVVGLAKIAKGDIDYNLNIKDNDIQNILVEVSNISVSKLLDMINQPQFVIANLNMNIDIKSVSKLNGNILIKINDGRLNNSIVKKEFNISLPPKVNFTLNTNSILNKNIIDTKVTLDSFVLKLITKQTIFNINTTTLNSDYTINIANLNNLYFITNQKMRGDMKIDGDIKFDKYLSTTFNSKKFDGDILGSFIKDNISLKTKNIKSLKLLHTLYYPKIFESNLDLNLDYNIITKKGISNITMKDGKFMVSELSSILKKITQKDITKEIYDIATIKTKIDNKSLDNKLHMSSKHSMIDSNKLFVDLTKSTIDSKFLLSYYKHQLALNVNGDLTNPKIKIDAKDLVKTKVKKRIDKFLKKNIGNSLEDGTKNKINNLLNKLF